MRPSIPTKLRQGRTLNQYCSASRWVANKTHHEIDPICMLWLSKIECDVEVARDYGTENGAGNSPSDAEIIDARRWLVWHGFDHVSDICSAFGLDGIAYRHWHAFIHQQKRYWNNDIHTAKTQRKRDKARRCYNPRLWDLEAMESCA